MYFKFTPILRRLTDTRPRYLSQRVSNLLLHRVYGLAEQDLEEFGFDDSLIFGGKVFPNIGVGCRGEGGKRKSELGGSKVPVLDLVVS